MKLLMDDMVSTASFHVIDAKTSYNMLLGRPWLHENFVVPSTWNQCFKYCRNGIVRKVHCDSKPFTKDESHFADAKYCIEDANKGKEVLPFEEPKACDRYNLKEKLSLGKLPHEATGKKPHGLNATQVMLKKKGHAIQDFGVGLDFTPPKPVRIAIKRVSSNYVAKEFSSTEDDKREGNPQESVFNRLGSHRKMVNRTTSR
ncbi:UNVERIFIED_CONTAM: hypothetical protein Scaly_2433100 [Sesamum calycinum]|uniref:Uncharacterized protein n=1 Tax=Sesamum calycinum TaxID=2727403 RepID=A0AAW2LZP0_9LAMI